MELAPPYVDTGLDAKHRESVVELQGGEDKAVKPMGLEKYLDTAMEGLKRDGEMEVTTGFSEMVAGVWRGGFWARDGGVGDSGMSGFGGFDCVGMGWLVCWGGGKMGEKV